MYHVPDPKSRLRAGCGDYGRAMIAKRGPLKLEWVMLRTTEKNYKWSHTLEKGEENEGEMQQNIRIKIEL